MTRTSIKQKQCSYPNEHTDLEIDKTTILSDCNKTSKDDDAGREKLLHAGEEGGLPEVLADAGGSHEVHQASVAAGQEDQVLGPGQREKEIW